MYNIITIIIKIIGIWHNTRVPYDNIIIRDVYGQNTDLYEHFLRVFHKSLLLFIIIKMNITCMHYMISPTRYCRAYIAHV